MIKQTMMQGQITCSVGLEGRGCFGLIEQEMKGKQ